MKNSQHKIAIVLVTLAAIALMIAAPVRYLTKVSGSIEVNSTLSFDVEPAQKTPKPTATPDRSKSAFGSSSKRDTSVNESKVTVEPTSTPKVTNTESITEYDSILDYIHHAESFYGDNKLFPEQSILDFLEKDLYTYSLFTVHRSGPSFNFKAYSIESDGSTSLIQEEWTISHYINGYKTEMKSDYLIATNKDKLCIPVVQKPETTPLGDVYVFYLYPLEDCYLSYEGELDTTYDPTDFRPFMFFLELYGYVKTK